MTNTSHKRRPATRSPAAAIANTSQRSSVTPSPWARAPRQHVGHRQRRLESKFGWLSRSVSPLANSRRASRGGSARRTPCLREGGHEHGAQGHAQAVMRQAINSLGAAARRRRPTGVGPPDSSGVASARHGPQPSVAGRRRQPRASAAGAAATVSRYRLRRPAPTPATGPRLPDRLTHMRFESRATRSSPRPRAGSATSAWGRGIAHAGSSIDAYIRPASGGAAAKRRFEFHAVLGWVRCRRSPGGSTPPSSTRDAHQQPRPARPERPASPPECARPRLGDSFAAGYYVSETETLERCSSDAWLGA